MNLLFFFPPILIIPTDIVDSFSTLEILFRLFTPQGGTEKSGKEFREGTYTPQSMGTKMSPRALRGLVSLHQSFGYEGSLGLYRLVQHILQRVRSR
jgi:hypothetical protein